MQIQSGFKLRKNFDELINEQNYNKTICGIIQNRSRLSAECRIQKQLLIIRFKNYSNEIVRK